jgi:hypothetical protein
MSAQRQLLDIASTSSSGPSRLSLPEEADWSSERRSELLRLLQGRNGFYAFESALHVRPLGGATGQEAWNAPGRWRDVYEEATDGHWFFAEDAYGGQFSIRDERVYSWDPETAEAEAVAASIEQWASRVLEDYDFLTGHSVAAAWQRSNGPLAQGDRLVPRTLFVLGGEYAPDNLIAMADDKGMRIRGGLWQQTKDLAPGTELRFDVTD